MTTDNKTLAGAHPGGRVRLGDRLPPIREDEPLRGDEPAAEQHDARMFNRGWNACREAAAALSAQPSPGGQGEDAVEQLRVQLAGCGVVAMSNTRESLKEQMPDKGAYGWSESLRQVQESVLREIHQRERAEAAEQALEMAASSLSADVLQRLAAFFYDGPYRNNKMVAVMEAALAARQPVGAPVTDAGRSAAYDAIDRFLRNNMDDEAYAEYAEHLEALWSAVPAKEAGQAPVAFDYPKFNAIGMGCGLEDRRIHFLIDAAQYGFDEALGQMKAMLDSLGPLYSAPPAQAVDLGQFRPAVELMEWQERGHANPDFPCGDAKKHAEALRLLALIDSHSAGGQP